MYVHFGKIKTLNQSIINKEYYHWLWVDLPESFKDSGTYIIFCTGHISTNQYQEY